MILIVGLGNPGEKFNKTRHNFGFRIVDAFGKKNSFFDFKLSKKANALISEGFLDEEKIILVKPQTFMNNSGQAVKKIMSQEKSPLLWVIHDDLDLDLGKIKISQDRSSAGHKGVQSIINEIKTKDFLRFRLGINGQTPYKVEDFVLQKFTKEEEPIIKTVTDKVCQALEIALREGTESVMSEYNNK